MTDPRHWFQIFVCSPLSLLLTIAAFILTGDSKHPRLWFQNNLRGELAFNNPWAEAAAIARLCFHHQWWWEILSTVHDQSVPSNPHTAGLGNPPTAGLGIPHRRTGNPPPQDWESPHRRTGNPPTTGLGIPPIAGLGSHNLWIVLNFSFFQLGYLNPNACVRVVKYLTGVKSTGK